MWATLIAPRTLNDVDGDAVTDGAVAAGTDSVAPVPAGKGMVAAEPEWAVCEDVMGSAKIVGNRRLGHEPGAPRE